MCKAAANRRIASALRDAEFFLSIADISLFSASWLARFRSCRPASCRWCRRTSVIWPAVSVEQFRAEDAAPRPEIRRAVLLSAFSSRWVLRPCLWRLGQAPRRSAPCCARIRHSRQDRRFHHHPDGLNFLGVFRIGLFAREARFQSGGKPATVSGAYVMGLAFPSAGHLHRSSTRGDPGCRRRA